MFNYRKRLRAFFLLFAGCTMLSVGFKSEAALSVDAVTKVMTASLLPQKAAEPVLTSVRSDAAEAVTNIVRTTAEEQEKAAKELAKAQEAQRIQAEQEAQRIREAEQEAQRMKAEQEAQRIQAEQETQRAQAAQEAAAQPQDLKLMASIIFCEAGNQSYEGQVAVGAVVMNRVRSSQYPGTIQEVLYQSGQFGPAGTGWLDQVLSTEGYTDSAMQAAKDALAGANPIGDCLYFDQGGSGFQLGDHYFH